MTQERTGVLLVSVLAAFTAQQVLVPVLAPLSRTVGLAATDLGLVMTVAAVLFAVTSLFWGRVVDVWGHRRVLLTGLTVALAGLTGFAVVAQAALSGQLSPGATLAGMIATRSVVFGLGLGAVPVAALSLVAASTAPGAARTAGVGRLGAAQGVAIALGPAIGGALGFAGLLGPVWAAPVAVAAALLAVVVGVRPSRVPGTGAAATGAAAAPGTGRRPAGPRPWDPRLLPVLTVGFLAMLSLGLVLIVLGFLVQDRLALDAAATVRVAGLMSFGSGVMLVITQGALVPKLGWSPARLLRTGLPIAVAALLLLAVAPGAWTIGAAMVVLALGLGMVMPGYTTAATQVVPAEQQGGVAGLVNFTNGLTFVVGPLAGTALYTVGSALPALVAAAACAVGAIVAAAHPALRRTAAAVA